MIGLPGIVDENISDKAKLAQEKIVIVSVLDESPAKNAGLALGDSITHIDEQLFINAADARSYIKEKQDGEITLTYQRGDEYFNTSIQPQNIEEIGEKGIGVGLVQTALISYPWHLSIVHGFMTTVHFTFEVLKAFGSLIYNLVTQQEIGVDLSGPVGIAVITGEVAALGFSYLLQFTAILSINLAVINVIPFPALDGGRILFLIFEKIRGKAVNEAIEALVHNLGFMLLMVLVILVTYNDLVRFGDQIIGSIKNIVGA
jgi:regulator of sigma E protease